MCLRIKRDPDKLVCLKYFTNAPLLTIEMVGTSLTGSIGFVEGFCIGDENSFYYANGFGSGNGNTCGS